MAAATDLFLIDATRFLEASRKAFLGAPLLVVNGEDHTFLFGVLRDLLRLRQSLGIDRGIVIVGHDAHEVASAVDIAKTVTFLSQFGIPVVDNPKTRVLDLCVNLASMATYIVTGERELLLLAKEGRRVILTKDGKELEVFDSEIVVSKFGVIPDLMPAFLALTDGPQQTVLTKGQAIALLERHNDLEKIMEEPSIVSSRQIRSRLTTNDSIIFQRLRKFSPSGSSCRKIIQESADFNIDNDHNIHLLKTHSFHSLIRLLPRTGDVQVMRNITSKRSSQDYHAIATPEDLQRLVTTLKASECCALDTESSDKDPHVAELFGVSFSVRKGEAFYIPVLESDLSSIGRDTVISALRTVLEGSIKVIGHNLKYDYVLLRKNGIKIANFHFDTMLAAYDCFGDWDFLNLAFVAKKILGKEITSYREVVGKKQSILDVPFKDLLMHACADADTALQLFRVLDAELHRREIFDQYRNETLALASRLGEWECDGIPMTQSKLSQARASLLREVADLKKLVLDDAGIPFDIDSEKELLAIILKKTGVVDLVGTKRLTLALMEELAVSHSLARKVVRYRRRQSQLRHAEEMLKAVQGGKVYPVFNQTKFDQGRLASVNPRLLDEGTHPLLLSAIDHPVIKYFPSSSRALDIMQDAAQDDVLRDDRSVSNRSNLFLRTQIGLDDVDHETLLLAMLIGVSKDRIRRMFFINQTAAASIRHDLEVRYAKSFKWLADYKKKTSECGFAVADGRRRWFEGLRSSNLEKREKALNAAVRWLLRY